VERRVVIVMTDHVHLIVTLVRHIVSIVIPVLLVVTVMIVLAGLIVMPLVEHRVVIVMTDHVRLIVTLVLHVVSIVIHVHRALVVTVMIVLAGLIAIHVRRALQRKSAQMKLKAALANVAQVAKCHCHQSVLAKIG
jgi:hypothetical protein